MKKNLGRTERHPGADTHLRPCHVSSGARKWSDHRKLTGGQNCPASFGSAWPSSKGNADHAATGKKSEGASGQDKAVPAGPQESQPLSPCESNLSAQVYSLED